MGWAWFIETELMGITGPVLHRLDVLHVHQQCQTSEENDCSEKPGALCYKSTSYHEALGRHSLSLTRRLASADRTVHCQFQAVFPVVTGSFPTNML